VRRALSAFTVLAAGLVVAFAAEAVRARDVLPAEGLVASSVTALPDQAALDAHYYLAEESLLGLGGATDAVFARYRAEAGEVLVLVAVYPSPDEAARVHRRFGGDFFSPAFEAGAGRFAERIETGDWAGAARRGPVLIVVLEAPDRASCEGLLRAAERNAAPRVP
jgi:hypothetical protein